MKEEKTHRMSIDNAIAALRKCFFSLLNIRLIYHNRMRFTCLPKKCSFNIYVNSIRADGLLKVAIFQFNEKIRCSIKSLPNFIGIQQRDVLVFVFPPFLACVYMKLCTEFELKALKFQVEVSPELVCSLHTRCIWLLLPLPLLPLQRPSSLLLLLVVVHSIQIR